MSEPSGVLVGSVVTERSEKPIYNSGLEKVTYRHYVTRYDGTYPFIVDRWSRNGIIVSAVTAVVDSPYAKKVAAEVGGKL